MGIFKSNLILFQKEKPFTYEQIKFKKIKNQTTQKTQTHQTTKKHQQTNNLPQKHHQ